MGTIFSPERLARRSARHPWLTIGAWAALIVAAAFAASHLTLSPGWGIRGSESDTAHQILEDHIDGTSPARETVVIQSADLTVDTPAYREFVGALTAEIRGLDGTVASVTNTYETGDPSLVSADGRTTILPVTLTGELMEAVDTVAPLSDLLAGRNGSSGFTVLTAGDGSIWHDGSHQFEKDLARGEMIGLPIALLVLVFVFGAAVVWAVQP